MDNESDEDQFPVLTCDIVFCLSLRFLQVVDPNQPVVSPEMQPVS